MLTFRIKQKKNKNFIETHRRVILGIAVVLVGLTFGFYLSLVRPALILLTDVKEGIVLAKEVKTGLTMQDLTKLSGNLETLEEVSTRTSQDFAKLKLVRFVPVLSAYYRDGEHLFAAAKYGISASKKTINSLIPFQEVLGLGGIEVRQVSAQEKLEQLVRISPQLIPSVEESLGEINLLRKELDQINPQRYPEKVGQYSIRETLKAVRQELDGLEKMLVNAKPLLAAVPRALGREQTQRYLILFQNDKELRPTGGFITAYALIEFRGGKFKIVESDDITRLDNDRSYLPAPWPILQLLKVKAWFLRDTNFSPDFDVSMETFREYYNRNGNPPIAGIIALDTQFVESLLELSGPIFVDEYSTDFSDYPDLPASCRLGSKDFTAENVVCRLELYAERLLHGNLKRKALLGDLMGKLVDWAFKMPPNLWKPFAQNIIAQASEKHILVSFDDPALQKLAEDYNFAGRVRDFEGDYLYINDANLAGAKSDLYIKRKVEQKIQIGKDGSVIKKLTLIYTNTGAYDGWLNTTGRNYVRVLVPRGVRLIASSGGDLKTSVFEDLGKTVFENFVRVPPLQTAAIEFEYELPFKLEPRKGFKLGEYKLLIQKQPGVEEVEHILEVAGQSQIFNLRADREIKVGL